MQKPSPPHPDPQAERISGWIEAGLYVLTIAILSVSNAFAISQGAHPIVFILYSLVISAVGMLIYTGPGNEPIRVMLNPLSWFVGLGVIGVEVSFCLILSRSRQPRPTLSCAYPFLALLLGWIIFRRSPGTGAWIGAAIVAAGVGSLLFTVDLSTQAIGLFYGVIAAASICLRGFASEFHPWNRAARSVFEKIRITGLVVLVTGLAGLFLVGLAATLVGVGFAERSNLLPAPADLWHWPTIVLALFVGSLIFATMSYLQFSSVVKIQTENFIATSAFMPLRRRSCRAWRCLSGSRRRRFRLAALAWNSDYRRRDAADRNAEELTQRGRKAARCR